MKRFQFSARHILSAVSLAVGTSCGAPTASETDVNGNSSLSVSGESDPFLAGEGVPADPAALSPSPSEGSDGSLPAMPALGEQGDEQNQFDDEQETNSDGENQASGFCRSFANGSGSTQPCYVGDDGAAHCIADDASTTKINVSEEVVSASGQNFTTAACVVTTTGSVSCGQYASMTEEISSGATQVSGSQNGWCALVNGGLSCEGAQPPEITGTVDQIACFYAGCCAKTTEGSMYCWGTQAIGSNQEVPLPAGKKAIQLGPGQDHICVLLDGGQVQCWGQDWNKQLGGLGADSMSGKTLVESGATAVVGGQFHTCIAFEDGHVECSSQGQTEGAGLDAGSLKRVTGIDSAIALSAGKHYSCALLSDRSISCWGRIGSGTTPVSVSGPAVAACE